jgi:acyl CoA:acetate/3-ketoacid CoA transferase alpha subunit/acyl CoA:acetate/3-ketoacid CoA transferase beta subunit
MPAKKRIEEFAARWRSGLKAASGPSKVTTIGEAIKRHVRDKDTLYFGGAWARPNAALFELCRCFWGRRPGFTLVTPALGNQHAVPIHGRLVDKAISALHATVYPAPAPNPIYVAAHRGSHVEFEDWSMHTLALRLQAAALNLPFLPTRSLADSDLGKELAKHDRFATVPDPFGNGDIGVVPALYPDVVFMHGLAADCSGNTLNCAPYYDNSWAAFAAKKAVIVTVEKIVEPEFIRRYAHLTRIPAHVVSSVCELPMGGHPTSVPGNQVPEIGGYADDYDFLGQLQEVAKRPEDMDDWIDTWITGCASHEAYLDKLGQDTVAALRKRTTASNWQGEASTVLQDKQWPAVSRAERQAVFAARQIRQRIAEAGYQTVLAGLGISSLAAWVAVFQEQQSGTAVELLVESGIHGMVPCPLDPFLFNYRNLETARSLSDIHQVLGVMTAGHRNRTLGVLSAAEVDRQGNLNTSRIADMLLTGSGGANDVASAAAEVLVTVPHHARRLVDQVEFITSPGSRVRNIVTDRVVMTRVADEFMISSIFSPQEDDGADASIKKPGGFGWHGEHAQAKIMAPPTTDELELLRLFDPDGFFLK